jgi:hypothetical protein
MTENERREALRKLYVEQITKTMRGREAKSLNWPGMPLGHFACIGFEAQVLREMLADGTAVLIERPRKTNPNMTASFVAVA